MIKVVYKNRFLLSRRFVQSGLLLLFAAANWWGWKILMGNYSSAYILETFYLSDPYAVLQTFAAGFIISIDAIIGATIVLIIYALIAGRSFCSWVCPVNIITDLASWVRKKWNLTTNEKNIRISRNARYWVLVLGIILSPIAGVAAFEVINPIGILHRGIIFGFGVGWTILVALFLFDLLVVEFGWCGHLCPLGAFYTGIGRYALIKVKHDIEKCTMCMKCFDVCHEKQVLHIIGNESGYVKGACSNCGRCVEACDDKALKYSIYNYKN